MELSLQELLNTVLVAGVGLCTYYVWKIKNEVIASKEEVIKAMKSFKEIYKVDEFEKYVNMSLANRKMEYEAMMREVEQKHMFSMKSKEDEHYMYICSLMHGIFKELKDPLIEAAKINNPEKVKQGLPDFESFLSKLEEGMEDPQKAREILGS